MSGVTGEQLHQELTAAAALAGIPLSRFVAPLFNEPNWKLEQLRIAHKPTQLTVDRVRALIAGDPIPPTRTGRYVRDARAFGLSRVDAEASGIPPSLRSINEREILNRATALKARVELSRHLAALAHQSRRPGQTLADRVRELRREVAA
jgi:hypothetical protein